MKWYQMDTDVVEQKLHVSSKQGLTEKQVDERRKQYGLNQLESAKNTSGWLVFLKQFQDFMVLVLLAATLIAGMLGEYIDAIAIMIIVLVNGFLGYFQEQKAENSLAKLKEMSAPQASVLREGEWRKIPSQEVAVGDVVRLNSGDRIPADVRIIKSNSLETEESALTGESIPVLKHATRISRDKLEAQDQANMAFMSTLVTRGSATGIAVGTGMNTVMGQIASLMVKTEKTTTPLEHKLTELGKVLIAVALLLTALVVLTGVYQGHPVYNMFLAGVSLAVAAIPEGLPAIVTVALSLGVQRMIRKKALVRQLSAVETLGCASVICSDKTGTMTENKMTVKEVYLNGHTLHVTGDGYNTDGNVFLNKEKIDRGYPNLEAMFLYGMLCNKASLMVRKGKYIVDGDPTEGSLLVAARKLGLSHQLKGNYRVIKELPFDSDRKRMSIVVEDENKMRFLISKGAPDVLLPRSNYIMKEEGRQLVQKEDKQGINQAVDQMADKALRTLAIAMKPLTKDESMNPASLERDMTLIGLYGMTDPPRKEVKTAIEESRDAGIKSVMITGDHEKTARAIATELNLLPENGMVLNGYQLNNMSVPDLQEIIDQVYVFARVTPEHKLKIVKAFQAEGHIVAMTGDGVNDAPAIKASDIGISMGESGTDVTKEASSLVLMDDNFATIKSAINEGRNIYENIRKFIRYLLASNVGEILVMLMAMLMAMPLPLVPVQILWVNLVTDGLPAMALGLDQSEDDVMKRGPRHPKEGVFARGLGFKIVSRGILIGIAALVAFMLAYQGNPENLIYAQTIAFTTLVIAQLIHVFDCRSEHSIFSRNPFENKYLVMAVVSSVLLLLAVVYWEPLQPIFHTTALGVMDWMLVLALSFLPSVFFGFSKK
ncbi:cation-translocating P-type ATPase [Lentibacillus amyloliquefaciens]|uniref:ATPase n=1 Tax=Lentibacillus amyloliquefaciens TaxID=1472767 RepID=A0A0U4FI28_9BACI|nr:cation-translocating P-type ATPase [Lentibacillus amyloliquefaciens]ALX47412.1 ATPase [Lentibacillus amyloliquefaciens]